MNYDKHVVDVAEGIVYLYSNTKHHERIADQAAFDAAVAKVRGDKMVYGIRRSDDVTSYNDAEIDAGIDLAKKILRGTRKAVIA